MYHTLIKINDYDHMKNITLLWQEKLANNYKLWRINIKIGNCYVVNYASLNHFTVKHRTRTVSACAFKCLIVNSIMRVQSDGRPTRMPSTSCMLNKIFLRALFDGWIRQVCIFYTILMILCTSLISSMHPPGQRLDSGYLVYTGVIKWGMIG